MAPAGFCSFELVFAIKPTGVSPLAKGELYATDQMRVAYLLARLGYEGACDDGGSGSGGMLQSGSKH